ncbi:MAG TPA: tetraacyldisaccharide 4'-kinase, partial [Xanthobacteraceae bacterium]|nr:tetraacyldisaccharide 4'-kinase [Xanthobacteraceae bacterium]
ASAVLAPFGAIYGAFAGARLKQPGAKAGVPVICIGDPTVGGAGKTPAAIAVAEFLLEAGETPFFVTRGYGGREAGPLRLDPTHGAQDVGDEPLLLAVVAPVIISADRAAGAKLAAQSGANVIVMDDGFQNRALAKDLSLLVIDGASGVGNGLVFPAGPLRAPLEAQIERAQGIVLIGTGKAGEEIARRAAARGKPVLRARLMPEPEAAAEIKGKNVLAYAGIGRPAKFFATLGAISCKIAERREFPDHHPFSESDARELLGLARARNLTLVTTAKDHARMYKNPALNELADASRVLPVDLQFEDKAALKALLKTALARR